MDKTTPVKNAPNLLIVDDDPLITDTLNFILGNDFNIQIADSRPHAIALLRQMDTPPDLALVDLGLPPVPHRPDEGFNLISELLAHSKQIKILVLSGQNDEANARHARSIGAMEFISKPCEPEVLKKLLFNVLKARSVEISWEQSHQSNKKLIGKSEPIKKLQTQISQYANSIFPVLIEGESGSGKELVAGALQSLGGRRNQPFFALNCAAISPTLVEPTLFGHAKGAFTGATGAKSGYFEDAGEGTLLLDEIGELPLDLQAKLLRVLENGEFQRVGETQTRTSNARVIAATNRDLRRAIREGQFRADLYHRLSVFTISVPPLRELGNDKTLLLEHFRNLYTPPEQTAFQLDAEALDRWQAYHFPGNVRELRNIVIRLATKYAGKKIGVREIEMEFDLDTAATPAVEALADPQTLFNQAKQHLQKQHNFSLDETLRLWEKNYIEAALKLTHGNMSQAAKLLGINRTTLYSRIEVYNKDLSSKLDAED
jgi:DNA-binding NtrC family response regulator